MNIGKWYLTTTEEGEQRALDLQAKKPSEYNA